MREGGRKGDIYRNEESQKEREYLEDQEGAEWIILRLVLER
jgi:hypothetical protein